MYSVSVWCAPRNTHATSLIPTNESLGMRLVSPNDFSVTLSLES